MSKFRNQRGDTIVEVLIAIAVVSSVLGATYAIMNRNLMSLRDTQERTEAVKLAQGQVEALKAHWNQGPAAQAQLEAMSTTPGMFCMTPTGIHTFNLPGNKTDFINNRNADPGGSYPPECRSGMFRIAILYSAPELGPDFNATYAVYVRWNSLLDGVSEARMVYGLR